MSKLFITDNGRVLKDHNEDLTRWRWAKKVLHLPRGASVADADLWIMASAYAGNKLPLRVQVNGAVAGNIKPIDDNGTYHWYRLHIPARLLRAGDNEFLLVADAPAMNVWRLAIAGPAARPNSFISFDRGHTWRNDCMGLYGALSGEYVVRLRSRSATLREPAPHEVTYADAGHPKLKELRAMLPKTVTRVRDPWKQVLALRTWVATRWSHDPFGPPYCPWDTPTILNWATHNRGHGGRGKVAMCVHFAVTFAGFATALGHRARCVAITTDINTMDGHFVCEVFDDKRGKWVVHDPNFDLHYEDRRPLSAVEVSMLVAVGDPAIDRLVRAGKGMPTKPARLMRAFRRIVRTGASYRLVSVWQFMNFITDPSAAPGHHGSVTYCEPQWVWFGSADDTAMFPQHADARWFEPK
jgi:hypothetical protein